MQEDAGPQEIEIDFRIEILDAIRRSFPCPRLRVADRGLREGMLVEMMREDHVWGEA